MSQIVGSNSPGCCLSGPSSNRDCEAETTSRSCVSRPRCCQIHNQLRGPTHLLPHCFPILLSSVLQGVLGLYRGYFTTLAREIPFSLIQFPLWEFLKKQLATATGQVLDTSYLPPKLNLQEAPKPWQASLCGAVAGGFSAAVTTPLDVAKTRIMLAKVENSSVILEHPLDLTRVLLLRRVLLRPVSAHWE